MIYRCFLIIPPGLEEIAQRELELKCPVTSLTVFKGGLEVDADLDWIEKAHLYLKVPTRILMRLTTFKCRDFPKLHQKILKFPWHQYLSHPEPEWEISCAKSRLNHTGRIEETVKSALSKVLFAQPLSLDWKKKNYTPQTFYIRLIDDDLTLSLDLTGEPLYKRGLQTIKGEAPLRENFAAAFIQEIFLGIDQEVTLVDPMCGSGTHLTEALTNHIPLHLRTFQFESAPFYKGRLVKKAPALTPLPIKKAIGIDINGDLLSKIQTTLPIEFQVKDSTLDKIEVPGEMIMICNPPYGERLKIQGKRGEFLREAWKKFIQSDRPLRFGWVLPSDMDDLFPTPTDYKLLQKKHLKNGGMAVTFWIWERQ